MAGHRLSQSLHRPARRTLRWRLGHEFDQQQHVIVAIDVGATGSFLVIKTSEAEVQVTPSPNTYFGCSARQWSRQSRDLTTHQLQTAQDAPFAQPGPLPFLIERWPQDGLGHHVLISLVQVASS